MSWRCYRTPAIMLSLQSWCIILSKAQTSSVPCSCFLGLELVDGGDVNRLVLFEPRKKRAITMGDEPSQPQERVSPVHVPARGWSRPLAARRGGYDSLRKDVDGLGDRTDPLFALDKRRSVTRVASTSTAARATRSSVSSSWRWRKGRVRHSCSARYSRTDPADWRTRE